VTADGQRVAVVTGGAGAIGAAIAAELSAAGHAVISLDLAGDPPAADMLPYVTSKGALTGQTLCVDGGLVLR